MDVLYHRCAGLDVHAKTIVVCALWGEEDHIQKEIETFSTFTKDLFRLLKWLEDREITHLAMESTGVYWKPVFNILEDYFDITLANAQRIKNVPGRKTDVSDAEWIAKLLRYGLIEKSFVPPAPIRELRDLTRLRKKREEFSHPPFLSKYTCNRYSQISFVQLYKISSCSRAMENWSANTLFSKEISPLELPLHFVIGMRAINRLTFSWSYSQRRFVSPSEKSMRFRYSFSVKYRWKNGAASCGVIGWCHPDGPRSSMAFRTTIL